MNKANYQDGEDGEPGTLDLYLEMPIGASGAVGTLTRSRGFGTPVLGTAGAYTIPLESGVFAILDVNLKIQPASYAAAEGNDVRVLTRTPGGSTPGITIQLTAPADGTAADADNGSILFGTVTVKLTNA